MSATVYYGAVVNPVDLRTLKALPACLLAVGPSGKIDWIEEDVESSMVQQIIGSHNYTDANVVHLREGEFVMPGFIDTHTHASQVPNMGSGQQYELLEWLENITFPMESMYADAAFAERTYSSVVRRIIDCGTTTCCYFATIHLEGTKILADIVYKLGQRAFVGKCNMDSNSPAHYIELSVEASVSATKALIAYINDLPPAQGGEKLVHPILTPRFAITCTEPLLKALGDVAAADESLRIQTHLSENPGEIAFTRSLFPQHASYVDIYASTGILRSNTILAHAIHMTEDEIELVATARAGISHCPTSNFHLKSGVAPIGAYLDRGLKVGLGTDVSGGYSPSIINAIQNASIASKVIAMENRQQDTSSGKFVNRQLSIETLLYLATLGGAAVCNMESTVGSFAVGKSFDALIVNVNDSVGNPAIWGTRSGSALGSVRGYLEQFFWCGDDRNISSVFVLARFSLDLDKRPTCPVPPRRTALCFPPSCTVTNLHTMSAEDELSDLTDIDELSDEDYADSKKTAKKGKGRPAKSSGKDGEYKMRHSLRTPRATTYSADSLFQSIDSGDIDLDPEYQRDVVWPETKQIKIIDSIFRNYYVPPIIFAVNQNEDGTESRTCIDGKQRLTSIHRFMQGLIPHRDSITNDKFWFIDNKDAKVKAAKKILPEKFRKLFANKQIVCVEYGDLTDKDEREIFQRVQLGVALTPAEKLKVLDTPRAKFVREVQEQYLDDEDSSLSEANLNWARSRGSDFRCMAQMLQCCEAGLKQTSFGSTEKWLTEDTAVSASFTSAVESTFLVYQAISAEASVLTKIAPVEFIAIGILIYKLRDKLTLEGVAKAVKAMRTDVRTVELDVRNNSRTQKAMTTFIDKYKAPPLGRGELSAAESVRAVSKPSAKTGTKRKAPAQANRQEDEDSEDDYVPAKKAKAATKAKTTASPRKRANVSATASTTVPIPGPNDPPVPAPPPTPPATVSPPPASTAINDDIMAQARQRIEAAKAASANSGSASAAAGINASASSANASGRPSTANNVENQLMGGGSNSWAGSNSSRVKTEPNGPGLSNGADSGRYANSRSAQSNGRSGTYDRDRDRRDDHDRSRYNGNSNNNSYHRR
ncbi:hypothetical protein MKEN_01220500 [Mycena kentingensis (nom. inval.)]|nr:hypothetical protein MKEN_01220500 [Mycena kentingensis (nom. inval.)]